MMARLRPLALLLLAAACPAQDWGLELPPPELELGIEHAGRLLPFPLSAEGLEVAARHLQAIRGAGYRESFTYRVLAELVQPARTAEVHRILRTAVRSKVRLVFVAADSLDEIFVGETLRLPDGSSHEVVGGDTLGKLAAARGVTVAAIRDANPGRLAIWPHAGLVYDTDRYIQGAKLGEGQLAATGDLREAVWTVFHELGHVGETNLCFGEQEAYGPDGVHYETEVITPHRAFREGWATFQASHVPGSANDYLLFPDLPWNLWYERAYQDYVELEPGAHRLELYLANEATVAMVLVRMEKLPPGRGGMARALEASLHPDCRDLTTYLAAYLELFPAQRAAVREILAAMTGGRASDPELDRALGGRSPASPSPIEVPEPGAFSGQSGTGDPPPRDPEGASPEGDGVLGG